VRPNQRAASGRVSVTRPSIRVTGATVPATGREVQGRLHAQLHEQPSVSSQHRDGRVRTFTADCSSTEMTCEARGRHGSRGERRLMASQRPLANPNAVVP
jgi:hypothetical protein